MTSAATVLGVRSSTSQTAYPKVEGVFAYLLEQGAAGVALIVVGWWGWTRSQRADEQAEKRLEDYKVISSSMTDHALTMDKLVNVVTSLTDEFRRGDR